MPGIFQQQIQVLHVDDEPSIVELSKTLLQREDDCFAVETAADASEGLQFVSDCCPDCIVSDYNMPGMDGIEFLRAIRKKYPDLPFILFTGKGSETVASDAIAAGVTGYLQKGSGSQQYELLANRIFNAVRSQRETERADRQEQLMQLTEFAGDAGGFEINVDTGELLLTDSTRQFVGLAGDRQITLDEAIELYHPDDQADVRQAVNQVAETGEQTRDTWRLQTLDNSERLVNITITPATVNGDATILRGAIHDVTEVKNRRRELEQIETLFQYAQDSLFLVNTAERLTVERVNPAYEEATGLSDDQVVGKTPREILGEQQGATVERKYRDCIERQEPLEYTEQLNLGEGSTQWGTRIAPVVFDDSVEYIVGATRDVTNRKERQQELRRLQQAIEDASVPISLADPSQPDRPLVFVNDAFEEMTGYPPEQALGRNCRFLQGEDTDSEKITALREAIDDEKPISVELRNYRRDGTEFWNRLTVTPIYDDNDQLVRYLGTQEDVTEQKEREQTLKQTQALLSDMEGLANIGAWEYNPETETIKTTNGFRDIFGIDSGVNLFLQESFDYIHPDNRDRLGLNSDIKLSLEESFKYVHPDDRGRLVDQFDKCIETGEPYEIDLRLTTAEGEQRWITARGEWVDRHGSDGLVRGYIRDNTKQKQYQNKLEAQNNRLEEFTGIVSHDLQNPLGVAETRLELAQSSSEDEHITKACEAIERCQTLTENLLTLAQQGKQINETDAVEIANVAEKCWKTVETAAASLTVEASETIKADRSRLRQLLENLFRNAVEHGGDEVTVSVSVVADGFAVADTGSGIPESDREKIFQAGYSTIEDGTGFGLRIVEQIAHAHGWEVTVTEAEQGGTQVEFTGVQLS